MVRYLEQDYHITKQYDHRQTNNSYPINIRDYQYPEDYVPPKFKTYDGEGNAREHLSRFLSAMNDRASDEKLCLKEFPKSLTGTAFTWYDNLKAESIDSWMTMISLFLGKFYSAKRKSTLIDLSRNGQRMGEEIVKYIMRFRRLALDCHVDVSEEELVEICVRGMVQSFKGSLINFRFQTFFELEEAAERIADCIEELPTNLNWGYKVSTTSSIPYNPRPNINENGNRQQMSDPPQKRSRWTRKYSRPPHPPLPNGREQIIGLLNQWVARGEVQLPPTVVDINKMNKDAAKYCHYHRRIGHPTIECLAIRSILEQKRESGEFEATRKMIEIDPFPHH
ncbi:uncharacterized protein LOC113360416 [Papaver somniferum]|uniref:uncharacterized protein LOC113360416 n=1 Tax=Papaver somniferum TaxID=3469 RepID=UPI000E6FA7AA|nr:uncharacterized protein LOC113360416 [Papaver somniferum]